MLAGLIKERGSVDIKQIKRERRQHSIICTSVLFLIKYLKKQTEPCNSECIQHFEQQSRGWI